MALTKEDLQAIGALMDSKLEPIAERLDKLETGQATTLEPIAERLDKLEAGQATTLEPIAERLDKLEAGQATTLEPIAERLDKLEAGQATTLEPIAERLDKLEAGQATMQNKIKSMRKDLSEVKENTKITRSAVNSLVKWADDVAVITQIKFPVEGRKAKAE